MNTITATSIKRISPQGKQVDEEMKYLTTALNELLASEYALFTKTLKYHWSVTGPRFQQIHEFLETHYRDLLEMMDDIAERVRVIGDHPIATLAEAKFESEVSESPGVIPSADQMLLNLYNDHVFVQDNIRTTLETERGLKKDPGTEDFLISILKKHEFIAWTLKSHLQ